MRHLFSRVQPIASLLLLLACSTQATAQAEVTADKVPPVKPVLFEGQSNEDKLFDALLRPTEVQFVETPLSEAMSFLKDRHQLPIELDIRVTQGDGLATDRTLTLSLKGVPLHSVLTIILRKYGLTWYVNNQMVLITSPAHVERPLVTQVYDVRDLMTLPWGQLDPDSLIEMITRITAHTWEPDNSTRITSFDGSLVIRQYPEVQREIQDILTQLRRAKHALEHDPQQALARSWTLYPRPPGPMVAKIKATLDQRLPSVEFEQAKLADVVQFWQEKFEIPILLDTRELAAMGLSPEIPVTMRLKNVSLRSAISHLLNQHELQAVVRDDVLWITTPEEAEAQDVVVLYLVRDLIDSAQLDYSGLDDLTELITTSVRPTSWDEVGGPGEIMYSETLDALIIPQTEETHRQIEQLLAQLRQAQHAQEPWSAQQWQQEREAYLTTPQLRQYSLEPDPSDRFHFTLDQLRLMLQAELTREALPRAAIEQTDSTLSALLRPGEFMPFEWKLMGLPVSREPRPRVEGAANNTED